MAKYVFVYHGGGAPESEEEGAAVMEAWTKWFDSLGSAVVDAGHPTAASATVGSDGSTSQGGGANPVTGYSIISADSLDAALVHAKGCPQLASGGTIEVAETIDM
ncbi:MAG: YciI family protein [Actinomycetota bacterium]|nr:YciI family protein [Actinomycetota bacterium]